jgi:hypothetical protein
MVIYTKLLVCYRQLTGTSGLGSCSSSPGHANTRSECLVLSETLEESYCALANIFEVLSSVYTQPNVSQGTSRRKVVDETVDDFVES